ncbi:hypothetical protein BS78_05G030100 [Paspalum vaginatum]|nr:hypothetical protein BS78_05G030100 [Paspalum vaginatum]
MDASSARKDQRFKELIEEERTKAMANQIVANLTNMCWDKCVTGSIGSSFSRSETSCLYNCAKRFAEVKMVTMKLLQGGSR